MRTLASILLLVGVVLQLLLGAVYLLSARYEPAGPKNATAEPRFSSSRQLALGGTVLGAGACGLVAALLALRRRPPGRLALLLGGASAVGPLGTLLVDGPLTVAVIALCLVALATGGLALSRRGAAGPAPSSGA